MRFVYCQNGRKQLWKHDTPFCSALFSVCAGFVLLKQNGHAIIILLCACNNLFDPRALSKDREVIFSPFVDLAEVASRISLFNLLH